MSSNSGAITANASTNSSGTVIGATAGGIGATTANGTNSGAITANAWVNEQLLNNGAFATGISATTINVTNSGAITGKCVGGECVRNQFKCRCRRLWYPSLHHRQCDEFRHDLGDGDGERCSSLRIQAFTTASVNNSGTVKAVATGSGALFFGITAATVNVVNSGLLWAAQGSRPEPRATISAPVAARIRRSSIPAPSSARMASPSISPGKPGGDTFVPVPRSPPRTTRSPCFPARASSARSCSARTTR